MGREALRQDHGSGQTLPIYIYNQINFGIAPEVNALASLMLLATMVVFALGFTIPAVVRRLRLHRAAAID